MRTATPKNGPRQLIAPSSPPEQRADRDAEAESRLIEHHGAGDAAGGRADDDRQCGGDEEGVAQTPPRAQPDDRADAVRRAGQRAEDDDQGEPAEQRPLGADATGHGAGHEHRDPSEGEVAGEEQLDLAGRGLQVLGDGGQDRIDQARSRATQSRSSRRLTISVIVGCASPSRPASSVTRRGPPSRAANRPASEREMRRWARRSSSRVASDARGRSVAETSSGPTFDPYGPPRAVRAARRRRAGPARPHPPS
jgi:hypothetical protein